ncbi:hypothetical protein MsAg5_12990 [Methanosarcinaceae archaeon Ag5]|uniref:Uncharacterized protein n=1 Tax=Methanolapillus africanus TaxID=3028297 RepID=A0AAE4MK65_9EURY|nr:hypothetical protein [Methanosarcinaceae archaeon Ag5]
MTSAVSNSPSVMNRICPCCGQMRMYEKNAENARSRYVSAYICVQCGVLEALIGDLRPWVGGAN